MKTTNQNETPQGTAKNGTMNSNSDAFSGLRKIFEDGLKDIYWTQKALINAFPKMIKKTTSPELTKELNNHLRETEEQVIRLETIFDSIGQKVGAMDGLIKEGNIIVEEIEASVVHDAGIIAACQKIGHYEIATYGILRQFAESLEMPEAVILLEKCLQEEKRVDNKLTEMAASFANSEPTGKGPINNRPNVISGLKRLFENGLKEIYWAEKSLTIALSIMSKKATSPELIETLIVHLGETEKQITRLQSIFESTGQKPTTKKCEAIDGLINEGNSVVEASETGVVRDAGIISVCQKIGHYKIAAYGILRQFAETLEMTEAVILLENNLQEEKSVDKKLTEVAVSTVNFPAAEKGNTKSNTVSGLRKLFEDGLNDIYWAEKASTNALSKMIKKATSPELTETLIIHLGETEGQIIRLQTIFKSIGQKVVAKKCEAMDGLIIEEDRIVEETEAGVVRDAGIIAACQKIEHYEIATYGTLRQFAETLGLPEAVTLLEKTLQEVKRSDNKLTEVAVSAVSLVTTEKE